MESTNGSPKIRYGAPDGPRRIDREDFDRREPLPYVGHEAVAQYLAAPDSERQFKSVQELADRFHVTPKTIYTWRKDEFVLKRVEWLTQQNKLHGDLVARRAWTEIMESAVAKAKDGDVQAMKFCAVRAWPEEIDPSPSSTPLGELDDGDIPDDQIPTWVRERLEREASSPNTDESTSKDNTRHES